MPALHDVIPRRDDTAATRQRRLAIVVQRYGLEVNGGAELHARLVARVLARKADVDVLTSRALDYHTWSTHFPAGEQWLEGVRVLRFDHPECERRSRRRHMPLRHKLRYVLRERLHRMWPAGKPWVAQPSGRASDGEPYLEAQGPTMPGLMSYLREHSRDYDALLFFTARFHPSGIGVLVDPRRSLLIPTLHDEKTMYLPHFHRVFRAPRRILYNTAAEQRLAGRLYGNDIAPGMICGIGIDPVDPALGATIEHERAAAAAPGDAPYLIYVGRVDEGKGCDTLFAHFERLLSEEARELRLVVVGQAFMRLPRNDRIECVGFVDDARKTRLMAGAEALVVPSRHESLSLVLLESLSMGRPVIVNRDCEVLRDHVEASGAGWAYGSYEEFRGAVRECLARTAAQRSEQAERGRDYVTRNYSWEAVDGKLWAAIDEISAPAAR